MGSPAPARTSRGHAKGRLECYHSGPTQPLDEVRPFHRDGHGEA